MLQFSDLFFQIVFLFVEERYQLFRGEFCEIIADAFQGHTGLAQRYDDTCACQLTVRIIAVSVFQISLLRMKDGFVVVVDQQLARDSGESREFADFQ